MREVYNWVPWFKELTGKIASGGEAFLIEHAYKVDWQSDSPSILQYGDSDIDPFSFFYFLAQKNTTNQREAVYSSCAEVFGLKSKYPCLFWNGTYVFPSPTPHTVALFHDGNSFYPNELWKFFEDYIVNLKWMVRFFVPEIKRARENVYSPAKSYAPSLPYRQA